MPLFGDRIGERIISAIAARLDCAVGTEGKMVNDCVA
jgi:hypothetical protein